MGTDKVKIKARTEGQKRYLQALNSHTVTICHGPAGSGKSYLACAVAARCLLNGDVSRIVLTRPTISCAVDSGFLPGTLYDKMQPFLIPLFDELGKVLGYKEFARLQQDGIIEVAPLSTMRGRTLDDAFIILDEAQNAIYQELKMCLTRLGSSSRIVLNGDTEQSDIEDNAFARATRQLADIDQIAVVQLTEADIVRHGLIRDIIKAMKG